MTLLPIVRIEAAEERALIPIKRAPGFAVQKHQKASEVDRGLTAAAQSSTEQSVDYWLWVKFRSQVDALRKALVKRCGFENLDKRVDAIGFRNQIRAVTQNGRANPRRTVRPG